MQCKEGIEAELVPTDLPGFTQKDRGPMLK